MSTKKGKSKTFKLENLTPTQATEMQIKWEIANQVELFKTTKYSRSLRRKHERVQKLIHERTGWRDYTI